MGECNTILSAYTLYKHLGWCCTHPSILYFKQHSVMVRIYTVFGVLSEATELTLLFNSLQTDKILKTFADNKISIAETSKFDF